MDKLTSILDAARTLAPDERRRLIAQEARRQSLRVSRHPSERNSGLHRADRRHSNLEVKRGAIGVVATRETEPWLEID